MKAGVPDQRTVFFRRLDQCGNAEVGDPHLTAAVNHDIGRLEIAMQHSLIVGGPQTGTQLPGDLDRLVAGQPADAPQQRGQVFAVDVFHRDEDFPVRLAEVIDAIHVGMRYLAGQPDFVPIPIQPGRIFAPAASEELQGHRLIQFQVVGPVHVAHPASSQRSDDAVAAGQNGSRRKSFRLWAAAGFDARRDGRRGHPEFCRVGVGG